MAETLYRIRKRTRRLEFITGRQLMDMKFHHFEADKPDDPGAPVAKWYCHNPDCVVRTVETFCKLQLHRKKRHPPMICPACRSKLEFLAFVNCETLESVETANATDS